MKPKVDFLGYSFVADSVGLPLIQPLWRNWPPKLPHSAIKQLKVIQGHHFRYIEARTWLYVCDTNLHPTSRLFHVIMDCWSNVRFRGSTV